MSELDDLLTQAREADQRARIGLRNPIAAQGEPAIDAMTDWLGDPRLAAFAIRVLEQIGRDPTYRSLAIAVLSAVDRTEMPPHLVGDLDWTLGALGYSPTPIGRPGGTRRGPGSRPAGVPGVPGRGYWVMRTSADERSFLWAEAKAGRLRQGWGVEEEQNLEVIAGILRRGGALSPLQDESTRALKMLASWYHGMTVGDVVVAPNLPHYGRLSVFRVAGAYQWSPGVPRKWGERFGHVLPVELLTADVDRRGPDVSDGLRSMLRPQTRLYNISPYGGDVERLIGGPVSRVRAGEHWTEAQYESLFGRFPPDGPRPSDEDVRDLAGELSRTPDAISWQWEDGAAYRTGRSASTTSDVLKAWLDRLGTGRA